MALLLLLFALPALAQPSTQARIDAVFTQWNRPDSPGAAVIAARNGEVLFKKGYGSANLEYGIPITPSTVFHVASISKQFTAFAVVLLAQEGKLSLDEDIRRYLPDMPDYGRKITPRHLIHHISGVRDQWELLEMAGWRFDDVLARENILKLLRRQRELNFDPGAEHLYSNAGYSLLAEIVERVSGEPFPEFCRKRIFEPLGMTRTHVHNDHKLIVKDRAYSYFVKGPGFEHAPLNYANQGATSLFTTVEDLAKWMDNFRTRKVSGAAAVQQMLVRGVLNNGREIPYAFGLTHGEYRGLKTVGHGGADAGYRSFMEMFPEQGFAVAVLGNLASMNTGQLANRVAEVWLEDRMKPASVSQPAGSGVSLTPAILDRYVGRYRLTMGIIEVVRQQNRLMASPASQPSIELLPQSETTFLSKQPQAEVRFDRDENGAWQMTVRMGGTEDKGKRIEPVRTSPRLADYAGDYYSPELDVIYSLVESGGKLAVRHLRFEDIRLDHRDGDTFTAPRPAFFRDLEFRRTADGRIAGFRMHGFRLRSIRFDRAEIRTAN